MMELRAILVDDELSSLQNLTQKIAKFCPNVSVVASSRDPEEALELIRQHQPDVVFLDIEMPGMTGLRMVEKLEGSNAEIIFTTAYDHYAVDAIRISAFDYLTKPIALKDLQKTVERLSQRTRSYTKDKMETLRTSLAPTKSQEEKLAVPTGDGLEFIPIKNIIHIESSSNYSKIFLMEGSKILVTKQLGEFEEMLQPYHFFRIHNSHLINLLHVKKYSRGEGGQVTMQNDDIIDISRRKKEEFLKLITG